MTITLEQASNTQLDYCLTTLTEEARKWLTQAVEARTENLDEATVDRIVSKLLADDHIKSDIQHHAEKVVERGFNPGRLNARCDFLLGQWELEGAETITNEILSYIAGEGAGINRDYFDEAISAALNPECCAIVGRLLEQWKDNGDQMPVDTAEAVNDLLGLEDEDQLEDENQVGTFGQAARVALTLLPIVRREAITR